MIDPIDIDAVRNSGQGDGFGKTAEDYANHRAGFPQRFFDTLAGFGFLQPGCAALDIGTGTGTVARGLARAGAEVSAIDPSEALIGQATDLDKAAQVKVSYQMAKAEDLPFEDATFDLAIAGQCWHWFDRPRAAAELARVLKPGGVGVIAHFDWLPMPGNVVAATEALIERYNPAWAMGGGTGIYPAWLGDLSTAGFAAVETFSFDLVQAYTHQAWRGRIRASAGVAASLHAERVATFDIELADMLSARFPGSPLHIPHRVWAVHARKPLAEVDSALPRG